MRMVGSVASIDRLSAEAGAGSASVHTRSRIALSADTQDSRQAHSSMARRPRGRRGVCETAYHERVASGRIELLAKELRLFIRQAGKSPEALHGQLPVLAGFARVKASGAEGDEAQLHFIMHELIPGYLKRLPPGANAQAMRELLACRDPGGQAQTLSSRYLKAAGHIHLTTKDFGRRQEPKLLLDCARYFIQFDFEDLTPRPEPVPGPEPEDRGLVPDISPDPPVPGGAAPKPPNHPSVGIHLVHRYLDHRLLMDDMSTASEIQILNTWIPELHFVAQALHDALENGAVIRILMVHPGSDAATLRAIGLDGSIHSDQVKLGVRHCLDVLATIAGSLDPVSRARLHVSLYDAMPSFAIYSIDDSAFISPFLHGHLAIRSPQLEIRGKQSLMGGSVFGEFRTLWKLAKEFSDIRSWSKEIDEPRPTP